VLRIHLPLLRERLEDIPLLAEHFLQQACRQLNKDSEGFTPDVMEMLQTYPWPGNIRELENEIFRAAALVEEGFPIQTYYFSSQVTSGESLIQEILPKPKDYREWLDSVQRLRITKVLRECGGNRSQAARQLGIQRTNPIRLMERLGIKEAESGHQGR